MPKQAKEINSFGKGIIFNTAEKDIPQDSAAFSLNVDPNAKDGILSGIKSNKLVASVDGNITRAVLPKSWAKDTIHAMGAVTPNLTRPAILVEDIEVFLGSNQFSFIGTKGYVETQTFLYSCPHMEKLVASISQLGNSPNSTVHAQYQPTGSGADDITDSNTTIDLSDATTTDDLHDLLNPGDYIQLADQAVNSGAWVDPYALGEIMKILTVSTDSITVERGAFNTSRNTYTYSKTYTVWINKISTGGKGKQFTTNMGYLVQLGSSSKVSGNHLKANGSFNDTDGTTVLKHAVTGASDKIVFDADAKTMTVTGNTTLAEYLKTGDVFHYYASAANTNTGKTFTIKYYKATGVFYLKEAPSTLTVDSATTHYFEPSIVANPTFTHQIGSGIGNTEETVVNDWKHEAYATATVNTRNTINFLADSNSNIVRGTTGPYSDANVFGSDLDGDYYPYNTNSSIVINSDYATCTDTIQAMTSTDNIIKTQNLGSVMPFYLSYGDIIKLDNEYLRVTKVESGSAYVDRGLFNTTPASHSAGVAIFKSQKHTISQEISKDLIKADTDYELTFWTEINTGQAAVGNITVVSTTIADYDETYFTLTSTAGTTKTYWFNHDGSDGATGTVIASNGYVVIQLNTLSGDAAIRDEIEEAIDHSNGHNGEITTTDSSTDAITLTQAYAGFAGNTSIDKSDNLDISLLTTVNFQYGLSPVGNFYIKYNGGYFDSNGNFKNHKLEDVDESLGYESVLNAPSQSKKWNTFESLQSVHGIDTLEQYKANGVKWCLLSYRFKTPKELPKEDLKIAFANHGPDLAPNGTIGTDPTKLAISGVFLSQDTYLVNTSKKSGISISSGLIDNSGKKDLVMYNYKDSSLRFLINFDYKNQLNTESLDSVETSSFGATEFNSTSNSATFANKNREVHVGFGSKKADTSPQWIGYLNNKVFGQETTNLYLDKDTVPEYDSVGANNIEKICLAGEWERMAATWDNAASTLTIVHEAHGMKNGDNLIVRQYMDTDNSWDGQGVWYVHDASGADALVLKRNTNLDNQPSIASGSLTFDTTGNGTLDSATGFVSYRPYYYYAISRGDRYILRITPEDRISGATTVDSANYPMGKIERSQELDFPIESICCSYAKNPEDLDSGPGVNTAARDGGHVYALSGYGDKIARVNVKVKYDEWSNSTLSVTESIFMEYKSFKWSNSHTNGNIDGTTAVFDSLAEESSPTITPAGLPSDIIETKGPIATCDWDEEDIGDQDVDPAFFDTRLWLQNYPNNEDATFTQGDRFLFCGKTEYNTGDKTVYFADRTPPTNILYGTEMRHGGSGVGYPKFKAGPFARSNPYGDDIANNPDITDLGTFALYGYHKQDGHHQDKIRRWGVYTDFDFEEMLPSTTHENGMETYVYSKPYVNWGENVGWNGTDNKQTALKVARYGLFSIADNDCDGILDGTGVVVPNNDSYSATEKKYGELHRRMSSHAVGLIGGSEIPWIRRAGQVYGNPSTEYYVSGTAYRDLNDEDIHWGRNRMTNNHQNSPEYMDATKCIFVCTDMHYGDIANENNKYTISSLAVTGGYAGDLADATKYTKVTTSEAHNLQSGDLVFFKGTGGWTGWNKSYYVVAVKDDDEFYVPVDSGTVTGTGEVWVGGFQFNESGNGTNLTAGRFYDAFHYAFNKDDKANGDVFSNHGAFSRKWYSEQCNIGHISTVTGNTSRWYYPMISNNVDRLNFLSGFMIRPFNMDDDSFSDLILAEGISVDMPSFPDTIYHTGASIKGTDTKNQFASKLFISNPGQTDTLGELQPSKLFICEWNNLYPNFSSQIEAETTNDKGTTQELNGTDVREVLFAGYVSSYITTAHATNLSGGQRDAVSHPIVQIAFPYYGTNYSLTDANAYAGLYITIVDAAKGFTQTRKIIGSYNRTHMSVHYPFAHAPAASDYYYVWTHANVATAPIRLFKEETFRHQNTTFYDKDPVLDGAIYKNNGVATFDGSSAGLVTSDSFHNLTTGDVIEIEGTASFNGTHSVTVKTPKIFSITTSASAAAETGTWRLIEESSSSAANPTVTSLNAPAIKMSFGDLDKRELKTYTVTDVANTSSTTNTLTTSANHLMETGEKITFVNSDTAAQTGSYIIDDGASATTFVVETTDTTTATGKTYSVTTNQWGGIGASTKSSSTIGKIRAGLAQWDKGDILGNANRYDATDNTRFISVVETSVKLTKGSISGENDYFLKNNNYKYKISLIYDGYQEGPLSSSSWVYNEDTTSANINVSVTVKNYSKRLSHVCVYRKDSEDAFYRLVRQISTETGWALDDGSYNYTFQDKGNLKASFEVRTGISELNKDLTVKYGMSVEVSGFLFVGDCSHNQIDDASNQIFRSKPGKFSIFDWSTDFAILKSKPTAMANYLGKLFVFDDNNIYRINPFSMQIEDTFEGVGCIHKDSVIVTEYGMYFASRGGAYFHNGTIPQKISLDIQKGGETNMLTLSNASTVGTDEVEDLSWETTVGNPLSGTPYVSFDSFNNTVMFMVQYPFSEEKDVVGDLSITKTTPSYSSVNSCIWAYSIERQRWDLWELAKEFEIGAPFIAKDGTVCISVNNMIMALNRGADKKYYKWLSKKLIMDTSTNKKVFNKIKIMGPKQNLMNDGFVDTDSDKLIIATDKGRITSGNNSTAANITYKNTGNDSADYKLSGSNKTAKWVQFKLEEMEEDVDSIGIVYRLRSVK